MSIQSHLQSHPRLIPCSLVILVVFEKPGEFSNFLVLIDNDTPEPLLRPLNALRKEVAPGDLSTRGIVARGVYWKVNQRVPVM
jgi:hypothetical protein